MGRGFLFFIFYFCHIVAFADSPDPCRSSLSGADAVFETLHEMAQELPERVRPRFFSVAEHPRWVEHIGSLGLTSSSRYIELNSSIRHHPFGHLVLVHEMGHIADFLKPYFFIRSARGILSTKFSEVSEQLPYGSEWLFLRKAYPTPEALVELKKRKEQTLSEDQLKTLEEYNFFGRVQNFSDLIREYRGAVGDTLYDKAVRAFFDQELYVLLYQAAYEAHHRSQGEYVQLRLIEHKVRTDYGVVGQYAPFVGGAIALYLLANLIF